MNDPAPHRSPYVNLAAPELGCAVVEVSDDFFLFV